MSHSFITLAFNLCLFILLPLATLILIVLLIKVHKKTVHTLKEHNILSINGIAMTTFVKSIPLFILYIIMLIPLFYFNHQIKQENYCIQVIQINKLVDPQEKILQERCAQFNLTELIQHASSNP